MASFFVLLRAAVLPQQQARGQGAALRLKELLPALAEAEGLAEHVMWMSAREALKKHKHLASKSATKSGTILRFPKNIARCWDIGRTRAASTIALGVPQRLPRSGSWGRSFPDET